MSAYKKFNIITGEYKGKPLEVYHCRISIFSGADLASFYTSINGKHYDGLLSPHEIDDVLNGRLNTKIKKSPAPGLRKFNPW